VFRFVAVTLHGEPRQRKSSFFAAISLKSMIIEQVVSTRSMLLL
jgi:hypothetical protein